MEKASLTPNAIISSSKTIPSSNKTGDNPPHAKAKTQYETITESFLCTMDQDKPIIVQLEDKGITFVGSATPAVTASQAADKARGSYKPPQSSHTYG